MTVTVVVLALITLLVYFVRYAYWGTYPDVPQVEPDSPALIAARKEVDEIERLAMGIVEEPVPVKRLAPSGPSYEQYKKAKANSERFRYMPHPVGTRFTHEIIYNMAGDIVCSYDPLPTQMEYEVRPIKIPRHRTPSTGPN